jgi:DNA-binding MarR family transcriptional regulator
MRPILKSEQTPDPLSAIRGRPGFAAAVRHSTLAPLALLDRDARFYRCIGDIPTYALGVLALYLHSRDRLSHRGLQEISGKGGLFSAGRATAILSRMRLAGLIAPSEPFVNGRRRRYSPKASMREAFRECYRIELKSISLIDKRAQPLLDDYDNADVFDSLIGFLAERLLLATKLDDEMLVPLGGVGRRSMGLFATYALAAEAFKAGRARAEGAVEISLSNMARRLGVSRPHVRRVLTILERCGVRRDMKKIGRFVLTPEFADAYELYFSGMFSPFFEILEDGIFRK